MTASAASSIKKFCNLWAENLSRSLASLGVVSPAVQASDPVTAPAPTPQEFESLVCLRFTGGVAIKGELLWAAEKPAALQLAQLLMSVPPDPAAPFGDAQRDAFAELLQKVAVQTASAWKEQSGVEIEIVFQATVEPAPVTAQASTLRLTGEKFTETALRLFLDEDLCAALSSLPLVPEPQQEKPISVSASEKNPAPVSSPVSRPHSQPLPANLALVLDVELEATIRFGERQMLLRDIFGLMAGAVVELDQMVDEPAQLLVAGRLVARGEVVVVDGNFGLRVTEVASVNERAAAIQLP